MYNVEMRGPCKEISEEGRRLEEEDRRTEVGGMFRGRYCKWCS